MASIPGIARRAPRPVRFDAGRHPRAKIGFVLLATEQTVQDDEINAREARYLARARRGPRAVSGHDR